MAAACSSTLSAELGSVEFSGVEDFGWVYDALIHEEYRDNNCNVSFTNWPVNSNINLVFRQTNLVARAERVLGNTLHAHPDKGVTKHA